jgi:hypothetical protein
MKEFRKKIFIIHFFIFLFYYFIMVLDLNFIFKKLRFFFKLICLIFFTFSIRILLASFWFLGKSDRFLPANFWSY